MQVRVTQEDIESGVPRDAMRCPIARALKRSLPDAKIEVSQFFVYIGDKTYVSSPDIRDFVSNFDNYLSVEPFVFDLSNLSPAET